MASLVPAGSALHGNAEPSVTLCGKVENEAGWPLEGVRVTAYGRGTTNWDHLPRPTALTEADGTFTLQLLTDFYRIVLQDGAAAADRAGARYLPLESQVAGHAYDPGACGSDRGKDLETLVLEAPMTGFLEVAVRDAITDGPLEEADVAVRPLGLMDWGDDASDDGVARVSCPLHVPFTLRTVLGAFTDDEREHTCTETLDSLTVALWRAPVALGGTLTDHQTGEDVADATVTVTPTGLTLPEGHPYALTDTSDADGAYHLALPWGDAYDGTAARGGYAPTLFSAPVAPTDLSTGIALDLVLSRAAGAFSGTVTDVRETGLVADLVFTGPAPAAEPYAVTSAPDGTFAITLPVGGYDVAVTAPGKEARTCALDLPHDADPVLDEGCLMLVSAGKGAVRGTVKDGLTMGPIGGVTVTVDATVVDTTSAQGSWVAELAPGDHTIAFSTDHFASASGDVELVVDEVQTVPDVALQRQTVPQTVRVLDGDGAPVEDAVVCPTFVPEDGTPVPHPCASTDVSGHAVFDLQWTSRGGLFDVGDYEFRVGRSTVAPFYKDMVCLSGINIDPAVSTDPIDCTAELIPAVPTDVGPLFDAHTGDPVVGATVSTTLPGGAACTYYTCTAATDGGGATVLHLPEGFSFDIAVDHADFQSPPEATGVPAGGVAFETVGLLRTPQQVLVSVVDAHTDKPLQGADVQVVPPSGFVCDPQDSFACTGVTNEAGRVLLEIPHGTFDFVVAAGEYDVVRDARFGDIEQDVRFLGTDIGTFTVPGIAELSASLVRQAGEPLVVDVTDFQGGALPGARLYLASERFDDFVCDPDGTTPTFACGTHLDASSGSVTLELPHGASEDHTWNITVQAPEHFRELRNGLTNGGSEDVTLWPLRFDLTVDPVDVTTGETAPLVVICVLNLDEVGASLTTPPPAESCKASGTEAAPLVFEDVAWRRTATSDVTDRFLIRAAGTLHFPATIVAEAGPASAHATVPLVPLDPTVPDPEASIVTGRVTDLDAKGLLPGDATGVVGARVFLTTADCPVGTFEGATGLDGTFQVPVLCHGDFMAHVVDARYADAPEQPTTVPQDAPLSFALARVQQTATITVHDATTALPVAGASVQLSGLDVAAAASGATGPDGSFSTSLPWGSYAVAVAAPDDQDWIVGEATSVLALTHTGSASGDVVLVSAPPLEPPATCEEDAAPDVCAGDDGTMRLVSVSATHEGGQLEAGTWLLVPPQVGALPIPGIGGSVAASGYPGPHAGTWTVAYAPSSLAGLSGMPDFPITFAFTYEVDGVERVLEAQMSGPLTGPSPFASPALVWVVNLHDEASVACGGPEVSCGLFGPVDLQGAARARFFHP